MTTKIRFVVATRENQADFLAHTATGRSLMVYRCFPFVEIDLTSENGDGLPLVYNRAIERAASDPALLVFVHDDVHLCDFFWIERLFGALQNFDLVGVAGNRRRLPRQPGWAFVDAALTWDDAANLSGIVGHGKGFPPDEVTAFGPAGQSVKLLDGVLLAAHSATLQASGLRFDERFDFHFYDLDLCREAESRGLRLGTCALSLVHESGGGFGTPAWAEGYRKYLEKWGE